MRPPGEGPEPPVRQGTGCTWGDPRSRGVPLLLIHGFAWPAVAWTRVATPLSSERFCVAIDLPGRPSPGFEILIDSIATLIERTCARADPRGAAGAGSVDVAGYSMGGRIALHLAASHPERVRRLLLISSSPGIEDPQERCERREADERLACEIEAGAIDDFLDRWESQPLFAGLRRLPQEERTGLRAMRRTQDPRDVAAILRAYGPGSLEPLWDRLGDIRHATTLIAGEKDARYLAVQERMLRLMPGAVQVTIPGCGHAVPIERPDVLVGLLAGCSARLDLAGPRPRPSASRRKGGERR